MWGIASVLWGIPLVLWRLFGTVGDNINTVGDGFSTVEDGFSTVEGIHYIGGLHQYMWGITSVQCGVNISTVEGIQYSGERILISARLVINNDEKISTFFVL